MTFKKQIPSLHDIQIGDILVSRYQFSDWANRFPWEDWHHVALVTKINPLTIIEAVGQNEKGQSEGPTEILFEDSIAFGKADDLQDIVWLRPIFPNPIRGMESRWVRSSRRKIISEMEARKRVVGFARDQIGEPYTWQATKWSEGRWYCSLLIYKSYSRSVTDMYLETYLAVRGGFFVTPEDILKSKRTQRYFAWPANTFKNEE